MEFLIILIGVVARLLPHLPNFTPIGAVALYSGATLKKRYIVLPIIAMLISDYFIGFHDAMLYVYGSFVLSVLLGFWLKKHKTFNNTVLATLGGSILFFLITNAGVWLNGYYPAGINGLMQSYVAGLPFFKGTLLGDFFYVGVFFGATALVPRLSFSFPSVRQRRVY